MDNTTQKQRGKRLLAARQAAGISQSFIAGQLGCSRQNIGAIEKSGKLTVDQLEAMCVHYGCTTDSIVFGTPQAQPGDQDGDYIKRQFARLDPWLREKLWMLYQVFVRQGAKVGERAPSRQD